DRARLEHVERDSRRLLIRDIDDDDVRKLFFRDAPRHRGAHVARAADYSHFAIHLSKLLRSAKASRSFDQAPRYMCSMMASPNSDACSSVAPSIRRAKSYVTRREAIAPSTPLMIRSDTSVHPMWRNIISPDSTTEPGFTLSRFAYFGAVPWVASNTACPV